MGHANHFLARLERAGAEEADLALDLYRDPQLLRLMLAHLALPEGASRVALSLTPANGGPWLVLTREAEFVTCLGEGMVPTGLFQVPHAEVLARLGQVRHLLQQTEQHARVRRDGPGPLYHRITHGGHRVSREDMVAIAPLSLVNGVQTLCRAIQLTQELEVAEYHLASRRHAHNTTDTMQSLGLAYWQLWWSVNHLFILGAWYGRRIFGKPEENSADPIPISAFLSQLGELSASLRAIWVSSRLGKEEFQVCKDAYTRLGPTEYILDWLDCLGDLVVHGLRHAKLYAQASKILARDVPEPSPGQPPQSMEVRLLELARDVLRRPEAYDAHLLAHARARYCRVARTGAIAAPYRLETPDAVPPELARPFWLLQVRQGMFEEEAMRLSLYAAPWIARATPEELYLPAEFLQAYRDPWTLEHSKALARKVCACYASVTTQVRPAVPGRNDPCSCGSGIKYKKCCGKG